MAPQNSSLKRLIVNGTEDPLWSATIEPVDRPTYSTETVDVESAVRRALSVRTDLEQSKKQIQSNDVSIDSLTDAQLPALDLTASYGVAGIGGTQFVRPPGAALGAPPSQIIPSGFGDALSLLGNGRAPTWNFLLNFSYPIGTSPAEAATARARLQQRQTIAQSRQLELADRDGSHQRGAARGQQPRAPAGGHGRQGPGAVAPRGRTEPVRGRAFRRTSSSFRRSVIFATRRTPNCERCWTIGARRSSSNAFRKSRPPMA